MIISRGKGIVSDFNNTYPTTFTKLRYLLSHTFDMQSCTTKGWFSFMLSPTHLSTLSIIESLIHTHTHSQLLTLSNSFFSVLFLSFSLSFFLFLSLILLLRRPFSLLYDQSNTTTSIGSMALLESEYPLESSGNAPCG